MSKVIKVENLSKAYQLGNFGTGTISRDLERFWARMRGKEDPFLKIGEINDRNIKGESDIVWSLKDINFEVEQGDVLGVIGRNGAGKSTLLKVLSRVTSPTGGSAKIKGRIASLLEVGTGFHPELTGRENIYLNGAILGMRRNEIKRKFDEIVDFSGVERYVDTPVKRYSSGMYVRLAFAVAAHLESEILIVDEVLAVGDAEFQKKCLGKMDDLSKGAGRTVLFVSHNMAALAKICNKGLYLDNGQVKLLSDVTDTINQYLRADNSNTSHMLKGHPINKNLTIKEFKFGNYDHNINDDIEFSIHLAFTQETKLSDLSILFYDTYEKRVSVVDLRSALIGQGNGSAEFKVSGIIEKVNLVGNKYNIGLFINSDLYSGDALGLLQIEMIEPIDNSLPYLAYPAEVRGNVVFNVHLK